MTTVKDIHARSNAARETFEVEEGQHTEAYVTSLEETLGGIFFSVRYDTENAVHNLIGLVVDDDEYTDRYGRSLVCPTRPKAYDEAIKDDDKVTTMVRKAEAIWKAKISDWGLYDVAEMKQPGSL